MDSRHSTIFAVSIATSQKVRAKISGCEHCAEEADVPLARVLDSVTGLPSAGTDYVLAEPIKCPRCFAQIDEETLVEWG